MSRVKKTGKMHYELLYIVPNKYTEDEAVKINDKVNDLIKEKGGEATYSEDWGKKKLTYQIKKFSYGYYKLIEFDVDGANLASIDRELRLASDVLRHQIVKKAIKTEDQIKKEKKISDTDASSEKKDPKPSKMVGQDPKPMVGQDNEEVEEFEKKVNQLLKDYSTNRTKVLNLKRSWIRLNEKFGKK